MARKADADQRRAWLLDTTIRTIREFDGVTEQCFHDSWMLQRLAQGCLAAIGQDMYKSLGLASEELTMYYRDLRNNLSHDYVRAEAAVLWDGIQRLHELHESVLEHAPPEQRKARTSDFEKRGCG